MFWGISSTYIMHFDQTHPHFLRFISSPPTHNPFLWISCALVFLFKPIDYSMLAVCIWYRALCWSIGNLTRDTSIKKTDSPFPGSINWPIAPQLEMRFDDWMFIHCLYLIIFKLNIACALCTLTKSSATEGHHNSSSLCQGYISTPMPLTYISIPHHSASRLYYHLSKKHRSMAHFIQKHLHDHW